MQFKSSPTTLTSGSSKHHRPNVASVVAAFLQDGQHHPTWFPEFVGTFIMGRSSDAHMRMDDERASRIHATVELRADRVIVRSQRRLRVNGVEVAEVEIRPGDHFELVGVRYVAMTAAMAHCYPDLDRLIGDQRTILSMLTMPRVEHVVLLGVVGAPLKEIARLHHDAIAAFDIGLLEATIGDPDSDIPDIEHILPLTTNGRIYIEGRRRDEKSRRIPPPHLTRPRLEQLAAPGQVTALTLGLHELHEVDKNLLRAGCRHFFIPAVYDRLRSDDPSVREHLINTTYEHLNQPWRAHHLHPDFTKALVDNLWGGDYPSFEVILQYANCAWQNQRDPADRLHARFPRRMVNWLKEIKLSFDRLRELTPDRGQTRRS